MIGGSCRPPTAIRRHCHVGLTEPPKPLEPQVNENFIPFNVLGLPAISIPTGFSREGLPVGIMLAGPRFSEGRLLAVAHAFEQATPWYARRPALRPDMPVPPLDWRT